MIVRAIGWGALACWLSTTAVLGLDVRVDPAWRRTAPAGQRRTGKGPDVLGCAGVHASVHLTCLEGSYL